MFHICWKVLPLHEYSSKSASLINTGIWNFRKIAGTVRVNSFFDYDPESMDRHLMTIYPNVVLEDKS